VSPRSRRNRSFFFSARARARAGDVIVQNNASSLVSQAVTQLAAAAGVRCVSLVRAPGGAGASWSDVAPHLSSLGATLVVSEEQAGRHEFAKTLRDLPAGVLGLNSSGGAAATLVARALAPRATVVTFGAAAPRAAALTAPLDLFTAADLTFRGFSAAAHLGALPKDARDAAAREAAGLVASGAVKLLVVREPFSGFAAALKRAYALGAERQVTLVF
jgi:NADPH:quinone reductase-like Zn-dependent oxidoreductase